jgi:iron complex transport system ATP-binding protein
VAVRTGQIAAQGNPSEVVTETLVREVFGIDCRIIADPVTSTPLVVPIGRRGKHAIPSAKQNGKKSSDPLPIAEGQS